jgi:pyruvate formate lyase activating enzyme
MKEARYYEKLSEYAVKCLLCPNFCVITNGNWGSCRGRQNINGVLFANNYAKVVAINLDPIEKKPLYHFYPSSSILSLGSNSCNLKCSFCQNYEISQMERPTKEISPQELLDIALSRDVNQVAFTYTEPFTWFEYILDCSKLLKKAGTRIVLVTNGYVNQEPLLELLPYIDAMNIDLKSMDDKFYHKVCQGSLKPVLNTIQTAYNHCHIEITNLVIPNLNDSLEKISELVQFIAELSSEIPLHFSRYFPCWKCKEPVTPAETLISACDLAIEKLSFVYIGNMDSGDRLHTHCPKCKAELIVRNNYHVDYKNMKGNECSLCGYKIYGRYND